jgi:hypothetical protein
MRKIFIAFSALFVSYSSYATIELTEQLSLSGFASTSIAKSNNETELMINRSITDEICFDCDTTFGLQLDYFEGNFKASSQIVKRPQDNWSVPELEWAYVGYSIDNIELRAGRLRLPLFLASEYFYVGHAYTYARPPEELYNSILGITAYNGASIVWNTEVFDDYQLSITPFIGFSDTNKVNISNALDAEIDIDNLSGVNFVFSGDYYQWNFSYFEAEFGQKLKFTDAFPGVPYLELNFPDDNVELFSLGMEYEFDSLKVAAEYQSNTIRSTWYTSLSYRMNKFVPYAVYGENHTKITQLSTYDGRTGSSYILGLRYDIKYNLSMNLEWQQFKSYAGQRGSFVETPTEADANLVSLMFNFVF